MIQPTLVKKQRLILFGLLALIINYNHYWDGNGILITFL